MAFRGLLLGIVFIVAGCSPKPSKLPYDTRRDAEIAYTLEDFQLKERSGKDVTKADLKGKVWIASFVFVRCAGPCPQVTRTMARLQTELGDQAEVRLVTFTVDPAHDNPKELTEYANFHKADKDRWLFLTGPEKEIQRLLEESFKIAAVRNPNAKSVGESIDHSTKLVVVDRKGVIRGYYNGYGDPNDEASRAALDADLKRLKDKVHALLGESP